MVHDSASESEPDDCDIVPEFVEVDPSGRYGRVRAIFAAYVKSVDKDSAFIASIPIFFICVVILSFVDQHDVF